MRHSQAIFILLLVAPPALAEPASDPWAQVPALPTACYTESDPFGEKAYAASEALESEAMRLEEANEAIAVQLRNMDITEQQQRMMTFMMEHPQDAQRYMEAVQQGGQAAQMQTPEMAERYIQLDTKLDDLQAQYDAALRQAMDPLEARRNQLHSSDEECNEAWLAQVAAVSKEENQAYDQLCVSWWKAGPFHAWFAEFKQYQIEWGAQQDEQAAAVKLNYEVMGIATGAFRPTYSLRAPIEYLRLAPQVFSNRKVAPVSEELGSCEITHG